LKATKLIFDTLDYKDYPSDEILLDMITNREGTKEKSFSKPINEEAEDLSQFATDPLKADEIISMIRKHSTKKIFTIYGYSLLGYEDEAGLKQKVKEVLSDLDPKEYIVSGGATSEGIGCFYEVAKEMGFETMGVVTAIALSYSGSFSKFVDRIYIVNDNYWGGFIPGTRILADVTKVDLEVSNSICAFGGGVITATILQEAKDSGIPLKYYPFDMDHKKAIESGKGEVDLRGAAFAIGSTL
jgi:hypothetical protein